MDRMSPLDASFLYIEDAHSHMHIGSVAIFEGPPPAYDEILAQVQAKLPLLPRYRQKVRFVPFDLSRPVWVDDPRFNLGYHVRHTAMPTPGDEANLRRLVGRLMSQQLDRHKPLWEMWVAEGLSEGRWALISKIHHCMVDGVSGTDLLTVLLDEEREPAREARVEEWQPGPEPRQAQLLAGALSERLINPLEGLREARRLALAPRRLARETLDTLEGLVAMRGLIPRTPPSTLNGPIGPHRRWAWARARLSDVKAVRAGLGGTVNDVVLAVITNGFRALLLERGEDVEGRQVRTLVPVSVRRPSERGTYNNRVSAMFAQLPVGISDPTTCLEEIHAQMDGLKESKQAVAGETLTSLSGFAPPLLLALGTRIAAHTPQRNVNTVTTNVPGPQRTLYAAGRRMLESFPYVPIAGRVRIGIAIFSYDGGLTFGVTGDFDTAPDIEVLCRGIEDGMQALLAAAAERSPGPAAAKPAKKAKAPQARDKPRLAPQPGPSG